MDLNWLGITVALTIMPHIKFGLVILGLLFCLTSNSSQANAQQAVTPAQNGMAPYVMPPMVPVDPNMQISQPVGYAVQDPNQSYPPQGYAVPPQQYAQWGPPQGYDPNQMPPQQGYPPQGAPPQYAAAAAPYQPQYAPETPRAMSKYEQQEAALRESSMVDQLEDVKQQKEMEESFRNGVLAEFDDGKNGTASSGFNGGNGGNGDKVKGGVKKAGSVLRGGMRAIGPTASYIGTFFLLNAATGGF